MYHTPAPAPQQASLFPLADTRPARPYRLPIYRVMLVRDASLTLEQPQIRSSRDAAVLFRQHLGAVDREHFLVAMLDQKNKVIGINTVSIGSLTASVVHPREVMVRRVRSRVVSLPEVARIRGNILGSPALPEVERQRGKQHGWKAGGDQRCRENRPARPAWQG